MSIRRRLDKLETAVFTEAKRKPLFVSAVPTKDGRQCGPAVFHHANIAGTTLDKVIRDKAESEHAFARRVYAMAVVNKRTEDMSDEELEIALAAADDELALEKAKSGRLSDESLKKFAEE